jgi:cytochrome c biogenesis protein CcmG, thiol:disulfide interchange protein DsbE
LIYFGKKVKKTLKFNRFLFAFVVNFFAVSVNFLPPANATTQLNNVSNPTIRYLPRFHLPSAITGGRSISSANFFDGKMRLLHFFGSWCISCRGEQAYLSKLAISGTPIIGVAVRDNRADVEEFLQNYGNPFDSIGADSKNLLQKAFGSNGVPETYIINGQGEIIYRHIGELAETDVPVFQRIIRRGY